MLPCTALLTKRGRIYGKAENRGAISLLMVRPTTEGNLQTTLCWESKAQEVIGLTILGVLENLFH